MYDRVCVPRGLSEEFITRARVCVPRHVHPSQAHPRSQGVCPVGHPMSEEKRPSRWPLPEGMRALRPRSDKGLVRADRA